MKSKKIQTLSIILICFFLISSISALTIDFYFSESCPHCQSIYPVVESLQNKYIEHEFNFLNVNSPENSLNFKNNGFRGVPSFIIKTCDAREIKFSGANPNKLKCEVQQMSTKECPTYSDGPREGSFFIN